MNSGDVEVIDLSSESDDGLFSRPGIMAVK